MSKDRELRILADVALEKRDDTAERLVGYAAVFGVETDIGGYFREMVAKGAFSEALKRDDIHALYNHDYQHVIGRKKAGTLSISEDDHGLRVEITPPNTQIARDLMENIRAGNVDQMSFAFSMQGGLQEWDETGDIPLRTIKQVGELFEVSVVPRGAYPTTEIGLRSLEAHRKDSAKTGYSTRHARMRMNLALREREG
jgi:HK97 family phage prohead protease